MRKALKLYYIIPILLVLLVLSAFVGWHFIPDKPIDIVVIDKTVPASKIDKYNEVANDYRKHLGFFWLLNQQHYCKDDGTAYNYETDYYGPIMDEQKRIGTRQLENLEKTPDLIYLSDGFGDENNSNDSYKGITYQDFAVVSTAHQNGSMVVGEFDINSSPTPQSVVDEMQQMFGVKYSQWSGRYVYDLADMDDIPGWAVDLHEREYGRPWDYKGEGMLLVSESGEIIILQKGIDYDSNLFTIDITDPYVKQYGKLSMNFYNWFHLTESEYGTDVIAEFNFHLNSTGQEKFSKISSKLSFPAITKKSEGNTPAYYFSGDFNDYVTTERYQQFVGADLFYNLFSYDRPGDITNFYWKFYIPLMKNLLDEADHLTPTNPVTTDATDARLNGNTLEVFEDGAWKPFTVKGFGINAVMPGSDAGDYTRDISVYKDFISKIGAIGGNCIRAYDLLPPEFYRALSEYNNNNSAKIYLFQSVKPGDSVSPGEYTGEGVQEEMKKNIALTIDAVHGNAQINSETQQLRYINDVSQYVLAYIGELDMSAETVAALDGSGYQFSGTYLAADSGAESAMAFFCDYICQYQQDQYGYVAPVAAKGDTALLRGAPWNETATGLYSLDDIRQVGSFDQFFLCYSIMSSDELFVDNIGLFDRYHDSQGDFPYGGYLDQVKTLQPSHAILVDQFGVSTNSNSANDSLNGLSEQDQGSEIVHMSQTIRSQGFLGGLICDFNDNWLGNISAFTKYTVPLKNNKLWKNVLDPSENSGVYAVESKSPEDIGMSLKDTERMSEMDISCDESYIYLTILLNQEIDYSAEQFIIGLDTYQRNNGEYLYNPKFYATSLSGMEFIVKFENKTTAGLYVIPSYNITKGGYASKESYTGNFDYLVPMKYGTFENSNSNFYFTGSTLHMRLPWNLLNFTDPSNHLVINDTRTAEEIAADPFGLSVTATEGIIFSVLIADTKTNDTLYLFPLNKQATGYKTFRWDKWEKPVYQFRTKESMNVISKYFKEN